MSSTSQLCVYFRHMRKGAYKCFRKSYGHSSLEMRTNVRNENLNNSALLHSERINRLLFIIYT
jgi:hypothetical protein